MTILKLTLVFLSAFCMFFFSNIQAHAAEPETPASYEYSIRVEYPNGWNTLNGKMFYGICDIVSEYPVYAYKNIWASPEGTYEICLVSGYYDSETDSYIGNFDPSKYRPTIAQYDKDGNCINSSLWGFTTATYGDSVRYEVTEWDGVPYFDSLESLQTFLKTGNDEGQVNKPKPDIENARDYSNRFWLTDFSATRFNDNLSVSWTGVYDTVTDLKAYENTFVVATLGFCPIGYAGQAVKTVDIGIYKVSDYGFFINISDYLPEDGLYLWYINCTPYFYLDDSVDNVLRKGKTVFQYWNDKGVSIVPGDDIEHGGGGHFDPRPSDVLFESAQYDTNCYFVGQSTNKYSSHDINNISAFYQFSWDDVACGNSKIQLTNGILIEVVYGTNTFAYSSNDYFWSDKFIRFDVTELMQFLRMNGVKNLNGIYGIRIIPYYTTKTNMYYGRASLITINSDGSISSTTESSGNPLDNNDDSNVDYVPVIPGTPIEIDPILPDDISDFDMTNIFTKFYLMCKSLISASGQVPLLVNQVFSFLPSVFSDMIIVAFILCIILRLLGR